MKKGLILALMALVVSIGFAQEKMKVVLSNGTTSEFEVKKIERVYFEGKDITIKTGNVSNITDNSATFTYEVSGLTTEYGIGIILATRSDLTNSTCLKRNSRYNPQDGSYSTSMEGLSPSTTYYYRAFVQLSDDYSGEYIYGDVKSFTTQASTLIYREPYTSWGATVSQTKNYMTGYTIYEEENNSIAYYGKYQETLTMYSFENNKLISAFVAIETSKTTISALDNQLKEKNYSYLGTKEGARSYISSDNKTALIVDTNEAGTAYYVQYYDYNWLVNRNSSQLFEEPYITWGTARSTVKSAVTSLGYTLQAESTLGANNYYLVYKGKHKENLNMYLFDASQNLSQVNVIFLASEVSLDDARDFLSSKLSYTFKGTNSSKGQHFYLTPDGKSYAVAYSTTINNVDYTYVVYVSYSSVSSNAPHRAANVDGKMEFETIAAPMTEIDYNSLLMDRIMNMVRNIKQ